MIKLIDALILALAASRVVPLLLFSNRFIASRVSDQGLLSMAFGQHPTSDMRAQNRGGGVVPAEPLGIDESGIHALGREFAV